MIDPKGIDPAIVIVPDGLSVNAHGETTNEPSFVYRSVLDWAVDHANGKKIYLAPANRFGGSTFEQDAGSAYLERKLIQSIAIPTPDDTHYVDTHGNALLLKKYLKSHRQWPLGPITLVSGKVHAKRAKLCFEYEGFEIANLVAVRYAIPKRERIVNRLFYYRYPALHRIYETLAYLRDRLRLSSVLVRRN